MAQIKKLSVAKVFGKVILSKLIAAPNQRIHVMDVIGLAVGTKAGDSDYGDWTALQGKFRATNAETGEVFESATLFLPDVALIPIQVALSQGSAVSFAISLYVDYVAERVGAKAGGSPFEYSWEPLLDEDAESDPLARIEAAIAAKRLALADNTSRKSNVSEAAAVTGKKTAKA